MVSVTGGACGATQVFARVSPSLSPRPALDTPAARPVGNAAEIPACARLRAAMLGSTGRRALLIACLPALLLTQPLAPGAARAADVTYSTPTTAAAGTVGSNGSPTANNGGSGANAIPVPTGEAATIDGLMAGGAGGAGGDGSAVGNARGGRGGDGGAGVTSSASATVIFNQAVTGGQGGNGGSATVSATNNAYGGGGGNGGSAAVLGSFGTVTVDSTLTGGNGGNGGGANRALGQGGVGGAGGGGLTIGASTSATINGSLVGGMGGNGGGGIAVPGAGGAGGNGLTTTGASATVTIHGSATGGTGGLGNATAATGAGGVGVQGSDLSLILAGTAVVTGGMSGNNATRANAITFTGGTNRLEFWSGATVTGNVVAAGTSTFALAGTANGSFDLSRIGAAAQYQGFGTLAKSGTGTWTLSNTPVAAMAWQIEAGTLDLGGTTQTIASLALTGGAVTNGTFSSANNFALQAGTVSAILAGSGGLAKTGAGDVTLAGVNTYTGATSVSAGRLIVNGSIASSSSLTVNAGGTLGGNGTVGTTAINGGTLAPGNSIGTLTIAGNLSFTAGSTYAVEVSPTNSDRVNVTGTATLGGAKVAAAFAAGTYVAKQYTILNATGGVSGAFGSQANTNLPSGFKSGLSYDPRNVYLDLSLDFTPAAPAPQAPSTEATKRAPNSGLSGNPLSVANALTNFFDRTGGIPVVFGSLTQSGLAQVAGEPATATQQTSASAMNQFMTSLADIAPDGRGVSIAPGPDGFAAYSSSARQGDRAAGQNEPLRRPIPISGAGASGRGGFGAAQFNGADAGAGTAASTSRIYGAVGRGRLPDRARHDRRASRSAAARPASTSSGWARARPTCSRPGPSSAGRSARAISRRPRLTPGRTSPPTGPSPGLDQLQGRFNANSWSGRLEAGHASARLASA